MQKYVSDMSVLCGAQRYVLTDGKERGTEEIRLYNGVLDITLTVNRALNINRVFYKGSPVSYVSKNGTVSPYLCGTTAYPFAKSFNGGFMYTCGLNNIGGADPDKGLTQHGTFSYIPASNVHTVSGYDNTGRYYVAVTGTISDTALFGEKLEVTREIKLYHNDGTIYLSDKIENKAYVPAQYMLMYHTNFGYPLLSEKSKAKVSAEKTFGISDVYDVKNCCGFEAPTDGRPEEVYRHVLKDTDGAKATLTNGKIKAELFFNVNDFPYLIEWKSMASGDYVVGLEPCTMPMPEKVYNTLLPQTERTYSVAYKFSDEQ